MNVKRITRLATMIVALMICLQVSVSAQTKEEVTKAYNDAMALIETDPAGAVSALNAVVEQCATLGEEGEEIKGMASSKIPGLQYKVGYGHYQAKDYAAAIPAFQDAKASATEQEDEELVNRIDKMLPQLHYINGNGKLKAGDREGAQAEYKAALKLNPEYARAYFGMSKTFRGGASWVRDSMFFYADKALEFGNEKTKTTVAKSVSSFLYKKAANANKAKKYNDAIELLEKAISYDTVRKHDRYHYQLGKAYQGLNQKGKACAAYKKVGGKYAKNAQYQLKTVLKCG